MSDPPRLVPRPVAWLSDVDAAGVSDGDLLVWDATARLWKPGRGGGVTGARDRYGITSTVTTDYPLTYVPIRETPNVFLNGNCLDEGIDYTVDYAVPSITLTAAAARSVGDVLWARYLTTSQTAGTTVPTTLIWGIRSNAATIIGSFDAVALVNSGTPFTDISADLTPLGGQEVDLVFGCQNLLGDPAVDGSYLFLRVYGAAPGLFRFDRVSGSDGDTLLQSIGGATTAATYAVTASGSSLTIIKNGVTLTTVGLTGSNAGLLNHTIVGVRSNAGAGSNVKNFSANGAAVTDTFSRGDADQLGRANTGQPWVGTS